MVEITLPIVLQIIQTVSLILGITYYLFIMRNSQRTRELTLQSQELTRKAQEQALETRQAQIFWGMIDKAFSKEGLDYWRVLRNVTWSSYEEWFELRRDDLEYYYAYSWFSQLYECIGASVRLGHMSIKLLAHCMPNEHLHWWERYRDVIYERRKRLNHRRYLSEWEYLYNELVKYLEEHPELAS